MPMANRRGATLAQLSSDKTRIDAHRFYDRLGYQASHEGFKRPLTASLGDTRTQPLARGRG